MLAVVVVEALTLEPDLLGIALLALASGKATRAKRLSAEWIEADEA
jgi:hypothetical protein